MSAVLKLFAHLLPAVYALTPVYDEASFNEIVEVADVAKVVEGGVIHHVKDASETMVFARQLETIKNRMYEKKYAELKGRSLVPFSTEGGADSEYITYRVWDAVTSAKIISDYSTDYETVQASAFEVTLKYFDLGNMFKLNMRELRRAAKAGISLAERYFMFARRGVELGLDDAIAVGVPQLRTYGLVNNPNVGLLSLTNGTWASATGEQILADMNQICNSMINTTLEIFKVTNIVMSTAAFNLIRTKLLNSANGSNITVLQAFQGQNPGVKVESWTKLALANAGGTNGRIVAYNKDPEILEFELGEDFVLDAAVQVGMDFHHYFRLTAAGLAVHHPAGLIYVDSQTL